MSRRRSSAIDIGPGASCPSCSGKMRRFGHSKWWTPRPGQPFHFKHWDICGCGHLQHYEDAKVYAANSAVRPQRELTPDQLTASRALRACCGNMTSKKRRQWLAEQMGIEERYAIISEFDAVECETVIKICA